MGVLLDLKIPGSTSADNALQKIVAHASSMKEVHHASTRLHQRLEGVLNTLKSMDTEGHLQPGEAPEKFAAIVSKCLESFDRYHEKRLVARLVKYQALMDDLRGINEDIDGLVVVLGQPDSVAPTGWKKQWEADQRAQFEVMEPIVLLNRLSVEPTAENLRTVSLSAAKLDLDIVSPAEFSSCSACNASIPSDQRACSSCGSYVFNVSASTPPISNQPQEASDPASDKPVENDVGKADLEILHNNDGSEGMERSQEDISHLLEHVRTGNEEEKRLATEELAKLVVSNDEIRAHIVEEGILPPLVHLLRTGTDRQKSWATNALVEVAAMNDGTRAAVVREGAIAPLVVLVRDGTDEQKRLATNVLAHLASSNDAVRVEIVREGAIAPLTALVQNGSDAQKQSAATVLAHLASSNVAFKADIAKQGVIAPLVSLVRTGTDGQKIWSAHALMNLASRNDANRAEILREGAKAPLMMLVRSGTAEQKVWASKAMNKLSSAKAIKAKIRLGVRSFFTGK
jgi:hypothetical protein